ncbi:MAG: 2-phospho-L-lactate guanylyltransferase [Acidimicrobiales bacterium]
MSAEPQHDRRSAAVLVPVKSFREAKGRLAEALEGIERQRLAKRMASSVIAAAAPLRPWVVCDDHDVASWACTVDAGVIWRPADGLNAAVTDGVRFLAAAGYGMVIIAHGDLPLASELAWVADFDGVTVVRDRRGDGTNVMALPTNTSFEFLYGAGSAAKHQTEAERLGLAVRIVDDERLGWDVDTPEDLSVFRETVLQAVEQERT